MRVAFLRSWSEVVSSYPRDCNADFELSAFTQPSIRAVVIRPNSITLNAFGAVVIHTGKNDGMLLHVAEWRAAYSRTVARNPNCFSSKPIGFSQPHNAHH